ncbi:hypothetical protein [Rhizobium leguminosarum]|uniref:hypothetical protein n=1 Tax=Rhizobium leguminosarum TaxID=384 RepID=UPI001610F888|nr:hypothetical protein [Rhizobium leguminosarum]MBB4345177.1 hypothetical protein [Rhizobium leguminosarum]MBB6298248.1 hypothetical protein [Rhizobium leguminosarum]
MFIELYASGTDHPALYDAYIDREGSIYPMAPEPRENLHDLIQVVYEKGKPDMTLDQLEAIRFLIAINGTTKAHLFMKVYEHDPLDMLLNIAIIS